MKSREKLELLVEGKILFRYDNDCLNIEKISKGKEITSDVTYWVINQSDTFFSLDIINVEIYCPRPWLFRSFDRM